MIRFSKIFLTLTILLLLLWQLPWCYAFFASKSNEKAPFSLYSRLSGDFISMVQSQDGKGIKRVDTRGNEYSQEEVDSLLPFFYMRQLMSEERFPDTICDVAVTPREAQMSNFSFRSNPADINSPKAPLYPLLESLSGRVELTMPNDVFRITKQGIEFIVRETNEIDESKSRTFTEAMKKKGFVFPQRAIAGNPTTRKEYDEGYLLLDAEGKLFNLKRVRNRPYVRAIKLPEGVEMKHLYVTENKDKKTLGYLTDVAHHFYVLNAGSYDVIQTGIPSFDPEEESMSIFGNMLDWTICIKSPQATRYYAIDAKSYQLIKEVTFESQSGSRQLLHFTSYRDNEVRPRLF